MKFSIIIPTFNEERYIGRVIKHITKIAIGYDYELIVCDGSSSDKTVEIARALDVQVLMAPTKSRAGQMNYAATMAKGAILYFVHADCLPPGNTFAAIAKSIENGFDAGCFRYKFDSERLLLKCNTYFTRFNGLIFRGGDQTLFIKKSTFININCFNERFVIMEDYDLVRQVKKQHSFQVIPEYAIVSARKYEQNSWMRVNFANAVAMLMFVTGAASPAHIKSTYHRLIKHPKDD